MGGFAFYSSYNDNNPAIEESLFQISTHPCQVVEVPKSETLIYIMKHFPHILTDITGEYILDRAVSSSLSKALLILEPNDPAQFKVGIVQKALPQPPVKPVKKPSLRLSNSEGPTIFFCTCS